MRKQKNFFKKLVALIVALAAFVSPLADYLPIIGEGVKVSAEQTQVEKIVAYAKSRVGKVEYIGLCQAFVHKCYTEAGVNCSTASSAMVAYKMWCVSTSKNNIPVGACVYFLGTSSYGHVGIYVGNNKVIHASSYKNKIAEDTLDFLDEYNTYLGWGWNGGKAPSGATTTEPPADLVTIKPYNDTNKNTITDTNAILYGQVNKPMSYPVTKIGIRIRVDGDTYDNGWSKYDNTSSTYTNSTYMYPYYDLNKELKLTLTPGTKYYFKFYAVVNGKDYWSEEGSFTTTGTAPTVTVKNSCANNKNTITDTNAILWGQVDKPKSYPVTKIGIRIRVDGSTYDKGWSKFDNTSSTYTNSTYMYPYYDLNKELKLTLTHATKYYFQFYAVVNGKEYWSAEGNFTTTGSHSYGSWTTTKAATCTETGTQTRTCKCGAKETQTIAALGHNWSSSWSKDGSNHWHACTRCSATNGKASHNWDSGKVTKEPTCTAQGTKTYTCQTCKQTKTETVNALGHTWSTTWSMDSNNHWHVCTRCNSTKDKAGHTYTTKVVPPSGSEQGYTLHTCTVCSWFYSDNYTSSSALRGDVNNDGKVTSSDLIRLAQYLAGWKVTINSEAADVNRDGKLTSNDIIKLAQLLAGWKV